MFNLDNGLTDLVFGIDQTSPFSAWIQHRHTTADGAYYPIVLNPLGGNVGIGTTGPGAKLDVSGSQPESLLSSTYTSETADALYSQLRFSSYGGSTNQIFVNDDAIIKIVRAGYGVYATHPVTHASDMTFLLNGNNNGAAPSEKMRIRSDGNVGIGTTSPLAKLTVMGQIALGAQGAQSETYGYDLYIHANNPTLFMDGIVSSSSPSIILQPRDSGGTTHPFTLAVTSTGNFAMTGGNVGIGIANPLGRLDVQGPVARTGTTATSPSFYVSGTLSPGQTGPASGNIEFRHDNGTQGIGFGYNTIYQTGSNTNQELNLLSRGSGPITLNAYPYSTGNVGIGTTDPGSYKLNVAGTIYTSGGCTGCSDVRWKTNIAPITAPLDKIMALTGEQFNWKTKEYPDMFFQEGLDYGLVAQDVEKVLPEIVYEDNGYKYIRYDRLSAILIEAVKEQQKEIQSQEKRMQEQASRIEKDEKDIEYLKQELIGSTAMLIESNKSLKANTKEIQDLRAEIVSLEGKVGGKQ